MRPLDASESQACSCDFVAASRIAVVDCVGVVLMGPPLQGQGHTWLELVVDDGCHEVRCQLLIPFPYPIARYLYRFAATETRLQRSAADSSVRDDPAKGL